MSKTQEELKELKNEYETLNNKLKELTEDELNIIVGGNGINRDLDVIPDENNFGTDSDKNVLPPDIKPRSDI